MKKLWIALGAVIGLFSLVGIAQLVASESGEVLVLETLDASGQPQETRVWVVDDAGAQWLRGGADSGWVKRLQGNPDVRATRAGGQAAFRAEPNLDPLVAARVNALMREKYGLADSFIAMMLGDSDRAGALPIRLDPR